MDDFFNIYLNILFCQNVYISEPIERLLKSNSFLFVTIIFVIVACVKKMLD